MPALRWTAFATSDLDNLWFHIAHGNVNAADQYLSGLELAALRHAATPEMGRNEPELSEKLADSIRSFRFRNHRLCFAVHLEKSESSVYCTRGKLETPICSPFMPSRHRINARKLTGACKAIVNSRLLILVM